MILYIYAWLGVLLRGQMFEVNNGNDDWRDLIHPEKYGLTQTQNFYMKVTTNMQMLNYRRYLYTLYTH